MSCPGGSSVHWGSSDDPKSGRDGTLISGRTLVNLLVLPFPVSSHQMPTPGSLWAVGNVWGDQCGQLAEPCSPIPELLPGMSHRDLGVGREVQAAELCLISSRLISSHLLICSVQRKI